MIRCFLKSRSIMAVGCVATLAVAIAITVRRVGQPLWLTLITLLLLLWLGVVLSQLLANMAAASEHQKLLAVLYVELDPQRFLNQYVGIPKLLKQGTAESVMTVAYLADGLCAAGRYDEALAALDECTVQRGTKNALALECLLCDSESHCLLQKGDADAASVAMLRYNEVLKRTQQEKPELAENMAEKYAAFQQELCYLQGNPVDLPAVCLAAEHSPIYIRRMELTLLQAKALARSGAFGQTNKCCDTVIKEGSGLALSKQAQKLKAQTASESFGDT